MNQDYQILHEEMLADIARCREYPVIEVEQVEMAFKIAGNYWNRLKNLVTLKSFESKEEEVDFYKNTKPLFTSYIEYLPMVYLGLSYLPESPEAQMQFWRNESERLQKFISKHADFVSYYRSGLANKDFQYFLPANHDPDAHTPSKGYAMDGEFVTSRDHLAAILLANEMYHSYALDKLNNINKKHV